MLRKKNKINFQIGLFYHLLDIYILIHQTIMIILFRKKKCLVSSMVRWGCLLCAGLAQWSERQMSHLKVPWFDPRIRLPFWDNPCLDLLHCFFNEVVVFIFKYQVVKMSYLYAFRWKKYLPFTRSKSNIKNSRN